MQAIAPRLLVTLMTFAVGISCARLADFVLRPVNDMKPVSIDDVLTHQQPGFRFVERSCESGCIERYETNNGQQAFFVLACFSGSSETAQEDMEALFENGRVVQSVWQQDVRGRKRRTVVLYPQDETGERPAKIFSYYRGDICFEYIEAGSLGLALDFERSGIKDSW
jgi:hypothetical protein